ncbi:superoxide dismutase [uncultured Clostridium sp.]|uniref:superoxide dismutase n=1 Tax=uncultured Clostridium sp. TaxID=59620 RepID=UPI002615906A|nr:superoxide dismutase [uncultured Clostridium sp.]
MKEFKLKPLKFDYDALEPVIDKSTVLIHHDKHQQAYTDNLNKALKDCPSDCLKEDSLIYILKNLDKLPDDKKMAVINNGGGVFNHEFYWEGLNKPNSTHLCGNIKNAIEKTFGSFEKFKEEFSNAGATQFGSGWAWLVLDKSNKLKITKTPNQICPISEGEIPLLTMDVWEHAYYLKYQNKRPEYIKNFFDIIDWDVVEERYNSSKLF